MAESQGMTLLSGEDDRARLVLSGDWLPGAREDSFSQLLPMLEAQSLQEVQLDCSELGEWDSLLVALLLQLKHYCDARDIRCDTSALPPAIERLLQVASSVPTHQRPASPGLSFTEWLAPRRWLEPVGATFSGFLGFIGETAVAAGRLVVGRANTRFTDFLNFTYLAGPNALGIIALTSVLVGMILAYLGAVQLQQLGAEIYVANLVAIGMLREMGALMTAIVMAGRTGAAYAAQLGTMQTNEEIDAITTLGISPIEFLVLPRILALVVMMPLLTLYADLLGIVGGGLVAMGMGITPFQYFATTQEAIGMTQVLVGVGKSVVFGALIAIAGCRAGINSGRSSAAVGQAATEAVVTAVVYLIVADAGINILLQQLGI